MFERRCVKHGDDDDGYSGGYHNDDVKMEFRTDLGNFIFVVARLQSAANDEIINRRNSRAAIIC